MTKYIVYAYDANNRKQLVKKIKRENQAIDFINDIKNLSQYGYLTLEMESDEGGNMVWDGDSGKWEPINE